MIIFILDNINNYIKIKYYFTYFFYYNMYSFIDTVETEVIVLVYNNGLKSTRSTTNDLTSLFGANISNSCAFDRHQRQPCNTASW